MSLTVWTSLLIKYIKSRKENPLLLSTYIVMEWKVSTILLICHIVVPLSFELFVTFIWFGVPIDIVMGCCLVMFEKNSWNLVRGHIYYKMSYFVQSYFDFPNFCISYTRDWFYLTLICSHWLSLNPLSVYTVVWNLFVIHFVM